MTSSHPRSIPCQWFSWLAAVLDRRTAPRLALLFLGAPRRAGGAGTLPLWPRLSGRARSLRGTEPTHRPEFRTKLVLAVELLRWAKLWLGLLGKPLWVVADGAYAKADFLKPAQSL